MQKYYVDSVMFLKLRQAVNDTCHCVRDTFVSEILKGFKKLVYIQMLPIIGCKRHVCSFSFRSLLITPGFA